MTTNTMKVEQPELAFVIGKYPLRGIGSVETEFRDYAIGLRLLDAPVTVIDLMCEDLLESMIGGFAIANWGRRTSRSRFADLAAMAALRVGERASDMLSWLREPSIALGARLDAVREEFAVAWDEVLVAARRSDHSSALGDRDEGILNDLLASKPETDRPRVYLINAYDLDLIPIRPWKRAAASARRAGDRWVLRSVTEYTGVPAPVRASAPFVDEMWVPSEFHRAAFVRAGMPADKIQTISEAVDTERFTTVESERLDIPDQRAFTFLALSHYPIPAPDRRAGWNQVRKAVPLLLKAFAAAFGPGEDVCLVIKGRGDVTRQTAVIAHWMKIFGREEMCPQILYYPGPVAPDDLPALYASADAFVGVSRGEGWGRPLAEAMAMELPTIATGFGGNTEFMSASNSYLVDFDLRPVAERWPRRSELGMWAEPCFAHFCHTLRQVFEHPADARARAARGATTIRENFSRTAVAARIRDRVGELCGVAWRG